MASIGEITATLRAETSQFQRGMQQAQRPLKVLKRELADVTAILRLEQQALAEGRVTAARAARNIEALTAKQQALRASITAATTASKSQAAVLKNTNPYRYAGSGLNMVRSGMSQLAVMALGTRSALGQVGQGLLLMGPGAAWTIAAAAGLAAVGFAYEKLTAKAKESTKKQKEELERLGAIYDRFVDEHAPGFKRGRQRQDISAQAAGIAAQIESLRARARLNAALAEAAPTAQVVPQAFFTAEIEKLSAKLAALGKAYIGTAIEQRRLEEKSADNTDKIADQINALELQAAVLGKTAREATLYGLRLEGASQAQLGRADAALKAIEAEQHFQDALKENAALIKAESDAFRQSATERARFAEQSRQRFLTDRQRMHEEIAGQRGLVGTDISQEEFLRRRQQIVDEYTQVAQRASRVMRDVMGEVGIKSGQLFVRGFLRGILDNADNMLDVLKRVLADILESVAAALSENFLKKLFSGPDFGGIAGAAATLAAGTLGLGNVSANAVAAMGGGGLVEIPVSRLNRHPSPQMVARDAQWLALYQETVRVANTQGIRMRLT